MAARREEYGGVESESSGIRSPKRSVVLAAGERGSWHGSWTQFSEATAGATERVPLLSTVGKIREVIF